LSQSADVKTGLALSHTHILPCEELINRISYFLVFVLRPYILSSSNDKYRSSHRF
jgi:hypothetical protein